MQVESTKEHRWLQKLVGAWTYETEAPGQAGEPPAKCGGTETVRSLGDVWVLSEGRGEMPGGGAAMTVMTLGYDPAKKRFVGTFIASMMTHLWVYEGSLDPSGAVLTLETEGPSFTGDGGLVKYRDVIEMRSEDERTLSSYARGDDGSWQRFMTATYRRSR